MIIDVIVLVLLGWSVLNGYGQGFMRGLSSIVSPVLGIWFALRRCEALASLLNGFFHNHTVALLVAFFLILGLVWIGIKLARSLLAKLVDWTNCSELDQFIGGMLGLAKGVTLAWLLLAAALTALPGSVKLIGSSTASVRILAMAERMGTTGLGGLDATTPGNRVSAGEAYAGTGAMDAPYGDAGHD